MTPFSPERLQSARELRGFTKAGLAKHAKISTVSLSRYVNGHSKPTAETLQKLAAVLSLPIAFFYGDPFPPLVAEKISFRAMSTTRAKQRNAGIAMAGIAQGLNAWFEKRLQLPEPSIPDNYDGIGAELAVASLRKRWAMGIAPTGNMQHLLEAKGVRLFSIQNAPHEIDAFCFWNGQTPYVFINTQKSAERLRFDAAHELGHLVLHRHGYEDRKKAEKEADAFAAAFLMPPESVLATISSYPNLHELIAGKKRWDVSLSALVVRLHRLDVLTEWHYRSLMIELTQKNYRTKEPQGCEKETSQLLPKLFSILRKGGIKRVDIAKANHIPLQDMLNLTFGLVQKL